LESLKETTQAPPVVSSRGATNEIDVPGNNSLGDGVISSSNRDIVPHYVSVLAAFASDLTIPALSELYSGSVNREMDTFTIRAL
jgi:hypothetical protein